MDRMQIPKSWVINGKIPQELWNSINTFVIPLMPGGLNPYAKRSQARFLEDIKSTYGEAIMLLLPEETLKRWTLRLVLISDLIKDPDIILGEANKASEAREFYLAAMKRCAYWVVTGIQDAK